MKYFAPVMFWTIAILLIFVSCKDNRDIVNKVIEKCSSRE